MTPENMDASSNLDKNILETSTELCEQQIVIEPHKEMMIYLSRWGFNKEEITAALILSKNNIIIAQYLLMEPNMLDKMIQNPELLQKLIENPEIMDEDDNKPITFDTSKGPITENDLLILMDTYPLKFQPIIDELLDTQPYLSMLFDDDPLQFMSIFTTIVNDNDILNNLDNLDFLM